MCGTCCGSGLDIFVNTMDVWNLRGCFGAPTGEIIEKYLTIERRPEFGSYPICTIRMPEERCPFMDGTLCGIHPARPAGCRLFPLAQYYDENGTARFTVFPENEFCKGEISGSSEDITEWLVENDFDSYRMIIEIQKTLRPLSIMNLKQSDFDRISGILFDFDSADDFCFRGEYPKGKAAAEKAIEWVFRKTEEFMKLIKL